MIHWHFSYTSFPEFQKGCGLARSAEMGGRGQGSQPVPQRRNLSCRPRGLHSLAPAQARRLIHFVARPLPARPALLGSGGSPFPPQGTHRIPVIPAHRSVIFRLRLGPYQTWAGRTRRHTGANTGRFGWGAITTLGSCCGLSNSPGAGSRTVYFSVYALCPSPAGMNWIPSFSALVFAFCCAAARSAFANCRS